MIPSSLRGCLAALSVAAVVLSTPWRPARAALSRDVETRIALESSLEKRLESVLRTVMGTQDLIVVVNAELIPESERTEAEVAPGIPSKQTPAIPGALGISLNIVRRVSATLIVDERARDDDVALAKKVAGSILGISAERGDALTVEKIRFHKGPNVTPIGLLLSPVGIGWICVVLIPLILAALQMKFLGPLLALLGELRGAFSAGKTEKRMEDAFEKEAAVAPNGAHPAATAADGTVRADLPFAFVSEHNLPSLIYLLRKDQPMTAVMVLQYLPPAWASKALAGLEPAARQEVVSLMSRVTQLDERMVRDLERTFRAKLDYLMGGEDKLVELLGTLPEQMQKDLLGFLDARDHSMTARLKDRIITFDDLTRLDAAEFKALSRRVTMRTLAVVLKTSEALRAELLPKVAPGMRDWLSEEVTLLGDLPPEAMETERRRVLDALARLVREGKIAPRKHPAKSPVDEAAELLRRAPPPQPRPQPPPQPPRR